LSNSADPLQAVTALMLTLVIEKRHEEKSDIYRAHEDDDHVENISPVSQVRLEAHRQKLDGHLSEEYKEEY